MSAVAPNLSGYFDAAKRLRANFGTACVFSIPLAATWPGGTKINPDTGRPYDATIVRTNGGFTTVTKTVLVILKQASPLRPQSDTEFAEPGLMSGMDIILDLDADDHADVRDASEFTVNALDYRVEEFKPFALGGVYYRWLIYGRQR